MTDVYFYLLEIQIFSDPKIYISDHEVPFFLLSDVFSTFLYHLIPISPDVWTESFVACKLFDAACVQ